MFKPAPIKKTYIYAKPAKHKKRGATKATVLKIRNPITGQHMPPHGAKVELTTAIRRMLREDRPNVSRLQRGPDLIEISEADFKKGQDAATRKAAKVAKSEPPASPRQTEIPTKSDEPK